MRLDRSKSYDKSHPIVGNGTVQISAMLTFQKSRFCPIFADFRCNLHRHRCMKSHRCQPHCTWSCTDIQFWNNAISSEVVQFQSRIQCESRRCVWNLKDLTGWIGKEEKKSYCYILKREWDYWTITCSSASGAVDNIFSRSAFMASSSSCLMASWNCDISPPDIAALKSKKTKWKWFRQRSITIYYEKT